MDYEPHHPSTSAQSHDEDLDAPLMSDMKDCDDDNDNYTINEAEVFGIDN